MSDLVDFVIHSAVDEDGDACRITLTVDLPAGVHIEPHEPDDPFLIPTVVTVNGLADPTVTYPRPVRKDLGWNDVSLQVLEGRLEFVVTGTPTSDAVWGGISYQPCVGGACLPPRTALWSLPTAELAVDSRS